MTVRAGRVHWSAMSTTAKPPARNRSTKTVDSILRARRDGRLLSHYKLAGTDSLAIDVPVEATVDEAAMSAKATISTPTIDRVGDLLIPAGCKLDNYIKNPVVLWAHGFDFIQQPIGISEDPNGRLTVEIFDDRVDATCFFHQKSLEAAQVFELVRDKVVRATSVRETPIRSSYKRDLECGDILLVDEWDLEEWSWCAVGVNPDAVRKALSRNRLAGKPISPSILKSLSAVAPQKPAVGRGFKSEAPYGYCPKCSAKGVSRTRAVNGETTCEKGHVYASKFAKSSPESVMNYTADEITKMSDEELSTAKTDADPEAAAAIDEEVKRRKAKADEAAGSGGESMTTEDAPAEEPDMSNIPYGVQVVSGLHSALTAALGGLESAMGPLENPDVKEALSAMMTGLQEQTVALEGLHSSAYPDQSPLKMDAGDETQQEEAMKAFLAAGRLPQLQLAGIGHRLKGLCAAKNLTGAQRTILQQTVGHLSRMASQAKSRAKEASKSTEAAQVKALAEQVDALTKQLAALTSR